MMSYAVIEVKGDEIRTLELCSGKDEARAARDRRRGELEAGTAHIAAVYGDFSTEGELSTKAFRLY